MRKHNSKGNFTVKSRNILNDWLELALITLPKNTILNVCKYFCLICLMSKVLKPCLEIIHHRMHKKYDIDLATNSLTSEKVSAVTCRFEFFRCSIRRLTIPMNCNFPESFYSISDEFYVWVRLYLWISFRPLISSKLQIL